jgi:hypothetical protein
MVIYQGASGLSKDRFVNTLHFDGDQWDGGLCDELWGKINTFGTAHFAGMAAGTVHEIRCYNPGLNPEGPYFSKKHAFTITPGLAGPTEVALCLSYATVDNPEQSTKRRRGRIYLGPLKATDTNAERPLQALMNDVLTLGEGIAQVGTAANVTWVMKSVTDNSYHKIESIWCDNAWDTQRRRGLAPLARTVRDVQ